jgi:hypothetical protein
LLPSCSLRFAHSYVDSQPQRACPTRALPRLRHALQSLRPRAVTEIHPTLARAMYHGKKYLRCERSGEFFLSLLIWVGDDLVFCGVEIPSLWEDLNWIPGSFFV